MTTGRDRSIAVYTAGSMTRCRLSALSPKCTDTVIISLTFLFVYVNYRNAFVLSVPQEAIDSRVWFYYGSVI